MAITSSKKTSHVTLQVNVGRCHAGRSVGGLSSINRRQPIGRGRASTIDHHIRATISPRGHALYRNGNPSGNFGGPEGNSNVGGIMTSRFEMSRIPD